MKTLISTARQNRPPLPTTYLDLCRTYLPRPLHSERELENAVEAADALAGFPLNAEQEDYLDAVSTFIEQYERGTRKPRKSRTGLPLLKFLLEQNGMVAANLSRLLGSSRGLGPMILRGKRSLTVAHIRRIAERFAISADLLIERGTAGRSVAAD